jgi:glycosyltransferase involved in cell wall biosynthesis
LQRARVKPRQFVTQDEVVETRSNPLRILVLAPQPFYQDRGTPIALRHVLEAWSRLGYEADVLTFPIGADIDLAGIRIERLSNPFRFRQIPIGFSLRKLFLDVQMAAVLWRRLKRRAADYVCIHAVEEAAFLGVLLGRRHGLPVIYDMQSSMPEQMSSRWPFRGRIVQSFLRACERWLLERANFVVCSAGLARHVQQSAPAAHVHEWWFPVRNGGVPARQVAALRSELGIPNDAPVVVYSGTFESYQGLVNLLKAIPVVRTRVPGTVFVLVGREGNAGDAVVREAGGLGLLGDGVHLLPRQPRARMSTFLALADVLVSPRSEGANLPLKIYDYLASGRAIVATDLPVHRPVLDDARAVLVGPTSDQLANGVVELLQDAPRRTRLAEQARAYARNHLGEENFVRWIGGLYGELAGNGRNGHNGKNSLNGNGRNGKH